jgi:ArsR family transcriptional regulator, arsenate/arsenite/antimonite-responsive transcriptional repressor
MLTEQAAAKTKQSAESGSFNLELFFNALADRTRLRLINLMGDDEVCVCFFVEVLETNQPKISRHLAYLKRAGLVSTRREGNWMHYRLATPKDKGVANILGDVRAHLANDAEMQRDREKLVKVCCAPQPPESIQGAPLPQSVANLRCQTKC